DEEPAVTGVVIRKHRAPYRMGVKNRSRAQCPGNRDVKQSFRRWLSAGRFQDLAVGVDFKELFGCQPAFVDRTRRDRQPKRLTFDNRAEISTRAEDPAAAVEIAPEIDEIFSDRL